MGTVTELKIAIKLATAEFDKGAAGVSGKLKDLTGAAKKMDEAGAGAKLASGLTSISTQLGRIQQLYLGVQAAQGVFAGASDLTRRADEYKNLAARVKLVSDTSQEAARAQAALFGIAQQQQAAVPELTQLYVRLAGAMRGMGRDQAESLQVTEAVALGLRVSGASAQESASAMLQLSQAFGSGVLRGEEFNAVNEASPRLMQALADGMGVAKESLRALAEEGKITSGVMADALVKSLVQLKDEAATLPETVGGAFARLSNALTRHIGETDKSTGATAALARGIGALADTLPQVFGAATAAGAGILAGAIARAAWSTGALVKATFQAAVSSTAAARGVTALGAASALAAGSIGVLARGLGALSALGGGPLGLALAALAVGWSLLSSQQAEAGAAADELVQKQKAVTEALKAERVKLVSLEKQSAADALDGWVQSYQRHRQFLEKHLADSLQAETRHADKLKELRAGLADFERETADTLRELARKGMDERAADADRELEIAEKLAVAQKAATEGRRNDAEALAKQAAQLAAQTGNTEQQIVVVKRAAEIVKASKAAEIAATERALVEQQKQTAAYQDSIQGVVYGLKMLDAMRPKPKIEADIEGAKANIAALERKLAEFAATPTVKTVRIVTVGGDGASPDWAPAGWASGGRVSGPGSGSSDSILARLSHGEFVMRAAAVERYGSGFMDAINRMALPRFAAGGNVGADLSARNPLPQAGATTNHFHIASDDPERVFRFIRDKLRADPLALSPAPARAG